MGVTEVIYKEEYRDKIDIEFLEKCGVNIWRKKKIGQPVEVAP
jgi:hypothetical protein